MTVQQESYDETDEDSSGLADDLDPSEVGRHENSGSDGSSTADEGAASEEPAAEELNTYFRCESGKQ
jgi:hypothetical protein